LSITTGGRLRSRQELKERIIALFNSAREHVWMCSSLNPQFYNDEDVKKAIVNAINRVKEFRLLVDCSEEEFDNLRKGLGWLFDAMIKSKTRFHVRRIRGARHVIIVDDKHVRFEEFHERNEIRVEGNTILMNASKSYIFYAKVLFLKYWNEASEVGLKRD